MPNTMVVLKSKNDPDALGPSIVDTWNLSFPECLKVLEEKKSPQHNFMLNKVYGTGKRYHFAYNMMARVLHNKKYLHTITLLHPVYSVPFWQVTPSQLLEMRSRLYNELAHETAKIVMDVFFGVAKQAHSEGMLDQSILESFYAICEEVPLNRRNSLDEFSKIVQTTLAQCLLNRFSLKTRRDSLAVLLAYLTGMTPNESERIETKDFVRVNYDLEENQYLLKIALGKEHVRHIPLGDVANLFSTWWLRKIKGPVVFCAETQFPDNMHMTKGLLRKILHRRLGYVIDTSISAEKFQENFTLRVYQAYEERKIRLPVRKILTGYSRFMPIQSPNANELLGLKTFYKYMEQPLGWWYFI